MLVAVYGTLKRAYGNHRLLKEGNAKFVDYKTYPGLMFHMGFFPGVVLAEDVHPDHPCHNFVNNYTFACEIFEVDQPTLNNLDRLEGHPQHYYRTPIKDDKHGEVHVYTQRAAKQLVGVKSCISGGFWYGDQSTVMQVQFGDGTSKPKILCWRGGLPAKRSTIIIPEEVKEEDTSKRAASSVHPYHDGYDDEDLSEGCEYGEAVVDLRTRETEIDLDIMDQVKEA